MTPNDAIVHAARYLDAEDLGTGRFAYCDAAGDIFSVAAADLIALTHHLEHAVDAEAYEFWRMTTPATNLTESAEDFGGHMACVGRGLDTEALVEELGVNGDAHCFDALWDAAEDAFDAAEASAFED